MSAEEPVFDPQRILGTLERHGVEYGELVGRSDHFLLSGVVVSVASIDIIDSKTHADRPKDRDALPELLRLRRQRDEP